MGYIIWFISRLKLERNIFFKRRSFEKEVRSIMTFRLVLLNITGNNLVSQKFSKDVCNC